MVTRLQIARPDILRTFDECAGQVLRRRDIERILAEHRSAWRLAQSTRVNEFIE